MNIKLQGKNALVCGSSAGIGKATAILMAQLGANVTLLARNEEKLQQVMNSLDVSQGQKHKVLVADFSNPDLLRNRIQDFIEIEKIQFHILVNNTGGPAAGLASEAGESSFIDAFSQHLLCNHILVKAVIEGMKTEGYGRIINVISTSVKAPLPGLGVSNTIRGAVANWAKTLANELGKYNITVNNVLPGATSTERLASIIENKSKKSEKEKEMVAEEMRNEIPMQRFGKPEEIAQAICFLASEAASYINGINLPVDGGRTASL